IYMALVASTWDASTIGRGQTPLYPGPEGIATYLQAWFSGEGSRARGAPVSVMMFNSLVMAILITFGKIAISIISAYAVVFFSFPLRMAFFWMIFLTLMLPVEVRIVPTFTVVSDLHMVDTYAGLAIPLIASAT